MKRIERYIIEKLKLDKDIKLYDKKLSKDAEVFKNFFYHMMKDMSWFDGEYEIDADDELIIIRFIINPTNTDFKDTVDGIRNRLKDRRMDDYMQIIDNNNSNKEILIKINRNV